MVQLVYEVDMVWDTVTGIVCLAATYYLRTLYATFKGSKLGGAYRFYLVASIVLSAGIALRIVLDFFEFDPSLYGLSIRDAAIIVALFLFAVGLRRSSLVWTKDSARE